MDLVKLVVFVGSLVGLGMLVTLLAAVIGEIWEALVAVFSLWFSGVLVALGLNFIFEVVAWLFVGQAPSITALFTGWWMSWIRAVERVFALICM